MWRQSPRCRSPIPTLGLTLVKRTISSDGLRMPGSSTSAVEDATFWKIPSTTHAASWCARSAECHRLDGEVPEAVGVLNEHIPVLEIRQRHLSAILYYEPYVGIARKRCRRYAGYFGARRLLYALFHSLQRFSQLFERKYGASGQHQRASQHDPNGQQRYNRRSHLHAEEMLVRDAHGNHHLVEVGPLSQRRREVQVDPQCRLWTPLSPVF